MTTGAAIFRVKPHSPRFVEQTLPMDIVNSRKRISVHIYASVSWDGSFRILRFFREDVAGGVRRCSLSYKYWSPPCELNEEEFLARKKDIFIPSPKSCVSNSLVRRLTAGVVTNRV